MNVLSTIIYFLVILLLLTLSNVNAGSTLSFPDGWRMPIAGDYYKDDLAFFSDGIPNHITADFNGDTLSDEAWILINENHKECGLFLFQKESSGEYHMIILEKVEMYNAHLTMGVSIQPSGIYPTACGKGYGECEANALDDITFKHQSINFYTFESANAVFYFDDATNDFRKIWMSD